MDLTMEDYFAERPDITPEMMEKARRMTEETIRAYELKQARKACSMTQREIAAKMGVSQKMCIRDSTVTVRASDITGETKPEIVAAQEEEKQSA